MKKFSQQKKEEGQGLVEYALVLVLVAVAIIIILTILGTAVVKVYAEVVGGFNGQSLTDSGTEHLVLQAEIDVTAAGPGACNVTITNATVFVAQDGAVAQNTSSGSIAVSGGAAMSGTTNNLGIVSGLSSSVNGMTCPGTLTIGNTGFSYRVTP